MMSSQKLDPHPYSGSIAESLAFGDEEGSTQPPAYKVNILALKQINRSMSREFSDFGDMNIDDSMHHDNTKPQRKTFKCFKCFGKKASVGGSILRNGGQHKCRECQGQEYIHQNHPLVAIMEQIIRKKLPHLPLKVEEERTQENKRETLELQYGCRDAIKEESFSYQEDSPPFCRNCNKQCDANGYRTCQKCYDFNICEMCFEKKRFSHYHPLVLKDTSRFPSRMGPPSNIKKNPELADSQTQQYLQDLQLKCSNCGHMIDICYEICLDCESRNVKYYICNTCSQTQQYDHNRMHQLQLRTISGISELNRLSSSQAQENLELNSLAHSHLRDTKRSIVRFNHDLMNDSCDVSNNNSEYLFEKDSQGLIDEMEFNLSDHMLEQEPVIRNKLSNTCRNDRQQQHLRKRDDDSPLFKMDDGSIAESDLSSSLLIVKCAEEQPPSPTPLFIPIFNSITHQPIQSLHKTVPQEEYVFNDYRCDMCQANPIKNKRYHCRQCEDYDLCEKCYIIRYKQHQHHDFQEVDGSLLITQRNSMFRSIKLKASSDLRKTTK